ncbi:MAG: hypothetical protein VCA55_09390 [Verrucomicrobiales bacterium]
MTRGNTPADDGNISSRVHSKLALGFASPLKVGQDEIQWFLP